MTSKRKTDDLYRSLIKELFTHERDPLEVIKWKSVYERFERIINATEKTADNLVGLVIKIHKKEQLPKQLLFLVDFFQSMRKPFKITKIVLPSCPITPKGKSTACMKLKIINNTITLTEKIIF